MAMKFTASLRNNETGEVEIFEGDEAVIVMMSVKSANPDCGVGSCDGVCAVHASPLTFSGWLNSNDFARQAVAVANLYRVLDPLAEELGKKLDGDAKGAEP